MGETTKMDGTDTRDWQHVRNPDGPARCKPITPSRVMGRPSNPVCAVCGLPIRRKKDG
jgi:hypothetical protein